MRKLFSIIYIYKMDLSLYSPSVEWEPWVRSTYVNSSWKKAGMTLKRRSSDDPLGRGRSRGPLRVAISHAYFRSLVRKYGTKGALSAVRTGNFILSAAPFIEY